MQGYWRHGLTAGVLLCLLVWLLCGLPATPNLAGVRSEPVLAGICALALSLVWRGGG